MNYAMAHMREPWSIANNDDGRACIQASGGWWIAEGCGCLPGDDDGTATLQAICDQHNAWLRQPIPAADDVPASRHSLRDYFAGLALSGILSEKETLRALESVKGADVSHAYAVAFSAYELADAMLAAREAKP